MSKRLIYLMAAACGIAVANLYYNQPLLADMARTFHASPSAVSLVPTLTQMGYALGLLRFVPLGDALDRRRLIVTLLLVVAAGLAASALSPGIGFLAIAGLATGATTVVPQLIIPFAARLAPPDRRGNVVGTVIGGLLIGILLGRTVAGLVGAELGWRAVFALASGASILLALVLRAALPPAPPATRLAWPDLIRSIVHLFRTQPQLREAAMVGSLQFAVFSAFWTTLVFFLSTPPYHYGARTAGLFGMIGAAGAAAAPFAGRSADRRGPRVVIGAALVVTLLSFVVFYAWGTHLAALILGVLLLDLGVQATGVSNQARIYTLVPGAESRVNTAYMVCYFLGGSVGSVCGLRAWRTWGWTGVCLFGAVASALALALHIRAATTAPRSGK